MERLTSYDENMGLLVNEEERLLSSKGFIDKDEMYKIMRHLAEKLKEYEDLEEQGRLLKLPCAVGDTVYQHMIVGVDKEKRKPIYEIFEAILFEYSLSSCGLCFWTETVDNGKHQNEVPLSAFNETVFLTRKEAEAKLAEMEGIPSEK